MNYVKLEDVVVGNLYYIRVDICEQSQLVLCCANSFFNGLGIVCYILNIPLNLQNTFVVKDNYTLLNVN